MSLFDKIIRDMTGGNSRSSNSSSYGGYSNINTAPQHLYQCRYCGARHAASNPRMLPHGGTGCRARGMGHDHRPLDHVWEQID